MFLRNVKQFVEHIKRYQIVRITCRNIFTVSYRNPRVARKPKRAVGNLNDFKRIEIRETLRLSPSAGTIVRVVEDYNQLERQLTALSSVLHSLHK
ncbi:hypothetical protein D9M68_760310 [compost metagenome]